MDGEPKGIYTLYGRLFQSPERDMNHEKRENQMQPEAEKENASNLQGIQEKGQAEA